MDPILNWKALRASFPLDNRPFILNAGLAQHGISRTLPPAPEQHCHSAGVWALHAHQYTAQLKMQGISGQVHAGYLSLVAPQVRMEFQFPGPCQHFYVLFLMQGERPALTETPAMQDLGARFDGVNARLAAVVVQAASQPGKAEAQLWTLLWELFQDRGVPARLPAPVLAARQLIEARLGQNISVAALARELEISHNQLTRQFRAALGTTVSGYVAQRRMERARQLLVHTTRPVKSIAQEVGLGDVQAFNKCLRRVTGLSPRQIRHPNPANPAPPEGDRGS